MAELNQQELQPDPGLGGSGAPDLFVVVAEEGEGEKAAQVSYALLTVFFRSPVQQTVDLETLSPFVCP